jgi:uncharacterized protein (UPF0548 family)
VKLVRPGDASAVERLIESLRRLKLTYSETGATLAAELPSGYRHDHYQATLGFGEATFRRAVEGLQSWQAHRLPGVRVVPHGTEVRPGATVVVTLGTAMLAIAAPCRVIEVIDEPARWGFAYGTLPGHPEQGEEAFVTSMAPGGAVTFEVTAFSRPADALVRLSGPVGRCLQLAGTYGYLRALRRFVERSDS